ncbi:NAD(P)H-dependent oxidoreductase [Neorhizobium sp. DT-125]|uniref:NAD(P)H-dependent oxidoreductase n=1 Tax=Neorhizobium sp. DT-125 TaxID=3396163 RepID=UPI003F1B387F
MRVLLLLAHPVPESYAASVARTVRETLEAGGHRVDLLDLYAEDFDPRLTEKERRGYFDSPYDTSGVESLVERLKAADALMLVFPQWWFNLPAVLKGFFDRVFVPDVAFEHDRSGARIIPQLTNIRHFWVFTTTGSPWWIVRLYMGDPVRRQIRRGIAIFCNRKVRFRMLTLHDMDRATEDKRRRHLERVRAALRTLQ